MSKKIKMPTNRNFGIVFFIIFLIISIWPLLNENQIRFWSLGISFIFFVLGVINSKLLTPLNKIWFKFGILIGNIIAPIIMGIIFFLIITPIGVILRLFGKDLLNLKKSTSNTYWINKDNNNNMKNQF